MCPSHHFTLTPCDAMCIAKNVSSVIEPSTPWSKPKSISTAFWHTTNEPCIPISGSSNMRYCSANLPKSSPTRIVSASEQSVDSISVVLYTITPWPMCPHFWPQRA